LGSGVGAQPFIGIFTANDKPDPPIHARGVDDTLNLGGGRSFGDLSSLVNRLKWRSYRIVVIYEEVEPSTERGRDALMGSKCCSWRICRKKGHITKPLQLATYFGQST